MENIKQILIANISMAIFLQAIKLYSDKYLEVTLASQKNDLTQLGEQTLEKHVWKCYVTSSKMGKSHRDITQDEANTLLENVKHIDDLHLIDHYKNLSQAHLEKIFITIVFFNHEEDQITEHLSRILFLKSIMKQNAKNGSIDTIKLEKEFKKLLKSKKVTDYIDRAGKYPLASFLDINTRTLKSYGGTK